MRRTIMTHSLSVAAHPVLGLWAETAADLMTPSPVSIQDDAAVSEAIALLADRGIGAAPVIDEAGHPVGVVSHADILIHEREKGLRGIRAAERMAGTAADPTQVRDIMTPAVFSVAPDASAAKVVEELVAMKVHRLFVVDAHRVLVGVINALDVLNHLRAGPPG
jgi:predicted transcriptional regulator